MGCCQVTSNSCHSLTVPRCLFCMCLPSATLLAAPCILRLSLGGFTLLESPGMPLPGLPTPLQWVLSASSRLVQAPRLAEPHSVVLVACAVGVNLVAPYCAIPRDYLSDTPLLRATGFLVSQHDQFGAIPPSPFLSVSPLESMRSGGAIPPLKRGISAILARYPMKTRQTGAIPPSAILSRKGIARYGGVSRTGPLRA